MVLQFKFTAQTMKRDSSSRAVTPQPTDFQRRFGRSGKIEIQKCFSSLPLPNSALN
jgi:hypothetical protein